MNQIYSMLNDIKTDFDSYERMELTEPEKSRMKNSLKNRSKNGGKKRRTGRLPAAAACALIAAMLIGSTAFAEEIQAAAKSVSWQIGSFLGIEKNLQDYVTVLNTSRSAKDYTVTLNEVILDHDELIVASTVKSNEKIDSGLTADANIYINGKRISNSAGGASRLLDDHTMESVISYKLDTAYAGNALEFEIEFDQIGTGEAAVKGSWDFRFKADGEALAADTVHIPMDVSFRLPNGELIKLTEFTSNSIGDKIYFTAAGKPKDSGRSYDMNLEGTDDQGNRVVFYLSYRSKEQGAFRLSDPLSESAKHLTLQPCAVKFPEQSGRLSNDFQPVGEAFELVLEN